MSLRKPYLPRSPFQYKKKAADTPPKPPKEQSSQVTETEAPTPQTPSVAQQTPSVTQQPRQSQSRQTELPEAPRAPRTEEPVTPAATTTTRPQTTAPRDPNLSDRASAYRASNPVDYELTTQRLVDIANLESRYGSSEVELSLRRLVNNYVHGAMLSEDLTDEDITALRNSVTREVREWYESQKPHLEEIKQEQQRETKQKEKKGIEELFGESWSIDELPKKVGPLLGAGGLQGPYEVFIKEVTGKDTGRLGFTFTVRHPALEAYERSVRINRLGERYIYNDLTLVKDQGKGLGLKLFSSQVDEATKAGFKYISNNSVAKRGNADDWQRPMNGAITWFLFGYDLPIRDLPTQLYVDVSNKYPEAQSMTEVMLAGGFDFWKEIATEYVESHSSLSLYPTFDLSEGSLSRQVLELYKKRKGFGKQEKALPQQNTERQGGMGGDEPDMTEEDIEILQSIWKELSQSHSKKEKSLQSPMDNVPDLYLGYEKALDDDGDNPSIEPNEEGSQGPFGYSWTMGCTRCGNYRIRVVSGEDVRNSSLDDEEFGLVAIHEDFPDVIPEDEIWFAERVPLGEFNFILAGAMARLRALRQGKSSSEAYDIGLRKDKHERDKAQGFHYSGAEAGQNPITDRTRFVTIYGDGSEAPVKVFEVDGGIVRSTYKTDFLEGGNSGVYHWIPKDEIWIEVGLDPHEMAVVGLHEYVERLLMLYHGYNYDKAHEIASWVEFHHRPDFSQEDLASLTPDVLNEIPGFKEHHHRHNPQGTEEKEYPLGATTNEDLHNRRSAGNIFGGEQITDRKKPPQESVESYWFTEPSHASKDLGNPEALVAAGLAVMAQNTGRVLLLQRALEEGDPSSGKWEFPGGHLEEGENPKESAAREWQEEVGLDLPNGSLSHNWLSTNGKYQGFVYIVPEESDLDLLDRDTSRNPDGDRFEAVAWVDPTDLHNHNIRQELLDDLGRVLRALKKAQPPHCASCGGSTKRVKAGYICAHPPCDWSLMEGGDPSMDWDEHPQPTIHNQEPWEREMSDRYVRSEKGYPPGMHGGYQFYVQAFHRWRVKPDVLGERRIRMAWDRGTPADQLAIQNDEEFRLRGGEQRPVKEDEEPESKDKRCPDGTRPAIGSGCRGKQGGWDGAGDNEKAQTPEENWYPDYAPVTGLDTRPQEIREREKPMAGHLHPKKKGLSVQRVPRSPYLFRKGFLSHPGRKIGEGPSSRYQQPENIPSPEVGEPMELVELDKPLKPRPEAPRPAPPPMSSEKPLATPEQREAYESQPHRARKVPQKPAEVEAPPGTFLLPEVEKPIPGAAFTPEQAAQARATEPLTEEQLQTARAARGDVRTPEEIRRKLEGRHTEELGEAPSGAPGEEEKKPPKKKKPKLEQWEHDPEATKLESEDPAEEALRRERQKRKRKRPKGEPPGAGVDVMAEVFNPNSELSKKMQDTRKLEDTDLNMINEAARNIGSAYKKLKEKGIRSEVTPDELKRALGERNYAAIYGSDVGTDVPLDIPTVSQGIGGTEVTEQGRKKDTGFEGRLRRLRLTLAWLNGIMQMAAYRRDLTLAGDPKYKKTWSDKQLKAYIKDNSTEVEDPLGRVDPRTGKVKKVRKVKPLEDFIKNRNDITEWCRKEVKNMLEAGQFSTQESQQQARDFVAGNPITIKPRKEGGKESQYTFRLGQLFSNRAYYKWDLRSAQWEQAIQGAPSYVWQTFFREFEEARKQGKPFTFEDYLKGERITRKKTEKKEPKKPGEAATTPTTPTGPETVSIANPDLKLDRNIEAALKDTPNMTLPHLLHIVANRALNRAILELEGKEKKKAEKQGHGIVSLDAPAGEDEQTKILNSIADFAGATTSEEVNNTLDLLQSFPPPKEKGKGGRPVSRSFTILPELSKELLSAITVGDVRPVREREGKTKQEIGPLLATAAQRLLIEEGTKPEVKQYLERMVKERNYFDRVRNYIKFTAMLARGDFNDAYEFSAYNEATGRTKWGLRHLFAQFMKWYDKNKEEEKSLKRKQNKLLKSLSKQVKARQTCPDGTPKPRGGTCSGRQGYFPWTFEEGRRQQSLLEPPKSRNIEQGPIGPKNPNAPSVPRVKPSPYSWQQKLLRAKRYARN